MLTFINRIFFGAYRKFIDDTCFEKASSLTFYSLLSVVPILAVAFGFAKGFGFESFLESEIKDHFYEQPELAKQIITFAYSALEQAHGGVIAALGIIGLLWTSIQLFSNVEHSLNVIWEVREHRSFMRQIIDYLALLILCPIIIVVSGSLSVFTIAQLNKMTIYTSLLQVISPYVQFVLHLIPFMINWLLFGLIYLFLPNTKVPWKSAFVAGVIAGTAYHIVEWIYIHFQIGVASYGAIYGSLAALPLFLAWINISWIIVLFGAEIAYKIETSSRHRGADEVLLDRKQLCLAIAATCAQAFRHSKAPLTIDQIASEIGIDKRVTENRVDDLSAAGILIKSGQQVAIARNPADIKIKEIFDSLEKKSEIYSLPPTPMNKQCLIALQSFDQAVADHASNVSLQEILL